MAGIGFELRKVFKGNSITKKVWGYSCAGIIIAGPMIMVVVMLLILEKIASNSSDADWEILLSLMVYSMIGALLVSSIINSLLARWSSDALFTKDYGRILPSIYGGALVILVPFGILYAILLTKAEGISTTDKILNWMNWSVMTMVYIYLGYLTAIKKYGNVVLWYLSGVLLTLLCSFIGIRVLEIGVITSIQCALFIGYSTIMIGYAKALHHQFPKGRGSIFAFVEYFWKYGQLPLIGLLGVAMNFVHIVIMWFGVYGKHLSGFFYSAPVYDVASFYAFVVAIPTNILFVVSMETKFYERFHNYFLQISSKGTLSDIRVARDSMVQTLKNELLKIEIIQVTVLMLYMTFIRFYLSTIGFTQTIMTIFYFLCIGYAAQAIGGVYSLMLLYFDDRKGALFINIVGFIVTAGVTYALIDKPDYYGIGLACGGIAMAIAGILRLDYYVKDIDNHTFTGQPIFQIEKKRLLLSLIKKLDGKALEKENKSK